MAFHKHPINFDSMKYIADHSGFSFNTDTGQSKVCGRGEEKNAPIKLINGTEATARSILMGSNNPGNTSIGGYHHSAVAMQDFFKSKYFVFANNGLDDTNYTLDSSDGHWRSSGVVYNALFIPYYTSGIDDNLRRAVTQYATFMFFTLTSSDFDDTANSYENSVVECTIDSQSTPYIRTAASMNAENGNTQKRINFTAHTTEDGVIKGMALYSLVAAPETENHIGYNVNSISCTEMYVINIGYVEFDTPIEATANVPFTVDVIFEFET